MMARIKSRCEMKDGRSRQRRGQSESLLCLGYALERGLFVTLNSPLPLHRSTGNSAVNSRYAQGEQFCTLFFNKVRCHLDGPWLLYLKFFSSSAAEFPLRIGNCQAGNKGMGFLYRIPSWSIQQSARDKGTQPQSRRYNVSLCGFPLALK